MMKVSAVTHEPEHGTSIRFHIEGKVTLYGPATHGDGSTTFAIQGAAEHHLRRFAAVLLDEADRLELARKSDK
jgi:hypothetical protein